MIAWVWGWIVWTMKAVWIVCKYAARFLFEWARNNPIYAFGVFVAFLRMWGTLVQSGQIGVLFTWGRAVRTLEPGFHPLIPILQQTRVLPARSITIDLPPQRLTTADGLVFDIDATLVCRITEPILATTEVNDLRAGLITVLSLAVAEVFRRKLKADLASKSALDAEIHERVQTALSPWGVTVEQAGLNTIAPTRTTTRLSQQVRRVRERGAALRRYLDAGLPAGLALALLGTTRQVVGHSRARYRRYRVATAKAKASQPMLITQEELEEALREVLDF